MTDEPDTIIKLDDQAAQLKLSWPSPCKLRQGGKVHGAKFCGHWQFQKSVIDEWMRSGAVSKRIVGQRKVNKGKKA